MPKPHPNNPAAFPNAHPNRSDLDVPGMTLRQFYAASALPLVQSSENPQTIAARVFAIADAMMDLEHTEWRRNSNDAERPPNAYDPVTDFRPEDDAYDDV